MKDTNICLLTGNLGRDAELRYTAGGQPCLNFSIANDQSWKNERGEEQKRVNWVNCVVFGKRGEAIQKWMVKGARILIQGKMSVRQYTDKEQHNRFSTEIVVDRDGDIQILRFKEDGQGDRGGRPPAGSQNDFPDALGGPGPSAPPPSTPPPAQESQEDLDLPF